MTTQGKRERTSDVTVTLRMPTSLLRAVEDFAADEFALRSFAIRKLLRRGLKASGRTLKRESAQ